MKKFLLAFSVIALFTACSSGVDDDPLVVITGEIEQEFTVDWRSLPSNQNIAITTPERIRELLFIGIQDFDVQDIDNFLDPTISAMYYDISGWDQVNSVGIFDVTISVVGLNGIGRRLTSFSISNLDNTVTLNNNQTVLSKEIIYNQNNGNVTLDGLVFVNQSILQGQMILEVEVAGRNVELQSPDEFEITLTMELSALASPNDQ